MRKSCCMCLMPFNKDQGKRESEDHCSYCFKNGEVVYKGTDIKEFKKFCYEQMIKDGINKPLAKFFTFLITFAPHWKKIKKENKV